jgi:hypothetical protein
VPLTIVRFEAYKSRRGQWVAGNVTGRTLKAKDFDDWYSDGLKITNGVIPPGSVALNAVNWHGSQNPTTEPTKWAFWAVDSSGKEHYAEVIVESVPINEPKLSDADSYAAQGRKWLNKREYDKAIRDFDSVIKLKPDVSDYFNNRGFTWHMKSIHDRDRPACEERALADYAEAIRLDPKNASAINNRAWLLATTTVDRLRDGKLALAEATEACELTKWKNGGYIDTLSVACAEVGDFEQAIRWQNKALEDKSYDEEDGDDARKKLALFEKRQPFRE